MLRPYIVVVPAVVVVRAVANDDDAVHVVRHDHRDVQANPGEVLRNFVPTLTRDPSGGAETHASRDDLPEQGATPSRANRDEVPPPTGVVEPPKSQRPSAMRDSKGDSFVAHEPTVAGPGPQHVSFGRGP